MEEVTSTIAAFYEDANDAFSSNSSLFLNTSDYSKSASNSSTPLLDPELESMKQSLTNMRFVVQIVLVPLVMLIGVCGNSITIAVLTRKSMRSSTNFYLTALAISDMMYLVLFFILSLRHHPGMKKPETWFYWHFYRFALWLVDASSATSTWLTVTFTVERYIAVCHPIKGKAMCTPSRAKKVIIGVFLCCFTLTATTPYEWKVVRQYDETNSTYTMGLAFTELGNNEVYRTVFYWFSAVVMILLPLLMLSIFNSFLINTVNKSRVNRKKLSEGGKMGSKSQNQETKITMMLIAVVVLALLCQTPAAIALLYSSFVTIENYNSKPGLVMLILGNLFNLLTACNAALNFVLYCAFSDKFRKTFVETFCTRCYGRPSPQHSCAPTAYTDDHSPRISRASSVVHYSRRNSRCSDTSSISRMSPTTPRAVGHTGGQYLTVPSTNHHQQHSATTGEQTTPLLNKVSALLAQNGEADGIDSISLTSSSATNTTPDYRTKKNLPKNPVLRILQTFRKGNKDDSLYGSRQSIVITCQKVDPLQNQTAV